MRSMLLATLLKMFPVLPPVAARLTSTLRACVSLRMSDELAFPPVPE